MHGYFATNKSVSSSHLAMPGLPKTADFEERGEICGFEQKKGAI
jgi:hypothetical protein